MQQTKGKNVVVAMSGGVDSSVAALLLHEQGYDVVGVSMQVWDYRNNGGCSNKATCCAPDDFTDARKVAARINVPYYVFDFEKTFRKEVIDNFINSYQRGVTPNPCVDCNSKVKFRELRERALTFGCAEVATGHYAIIEKKGGSYHLLRGNDPAKDQSYFLYGIKREELPNTIFPVGHMTKDEVREIARQAGLSTASKPESQDICFVSGKVQDFLVSIGAKRSRGNIVTKDGIKLGEHDGIHNYTVGQRKGLGLGGAENPYYVLEIEAGSNSVIVGSKKDLEQESFMVSELSWIDDDICNKILEASYPINFEACVQVRSRHSAVPAKVILKSETEAEVSFSGEWATVSPGQAAVFYDLSNRRLLGGGRIVKMNLEHRFPEAISTALLA